MARIPNGTGDFRQHSQTFNANNDLTTSISWKGSKDIATISIFPNPAKDKVFIQFENEQGRIEVVRLFDLQARRILEEKPYQAEVEIQLSSISDGLYFLQVNDRYWHKLKVEK